MPLNLQKNYKERTYKKSLGTVLFAKIFEIFSRISFYDVASGLNIGYNTFIAFQCLIYNIVLSRFVIVNHNLNNKFKLIENSVVSGILQYILKLHKNQMSIKYMKYRLKNHHFAFQCQLSQMSLFVMIYLSIEINYMSQTFIESISNFWQVEYKQQ